jgi:hypothetical protein
LLIKKEFKHFFLNRRWHVSQVEKFDKDGNLILEMKVPVGVDLINWILSWSDAIIVLEPPELIKKVVNRLAQALNNYKIMFPDIKPKLDETEDDKYEAPTEEKMETSTPKEVKEPATKYKITLKSKKKS